MGKMIKTTNINKLFLHVVQACLLLMLPSFMACSHIDENDRLIEVKTDDQQPAPVPDDPSTPTPTSTVKNVLLEDFTGQRCNNCPTGTEVIEQLQEAYPDRLVAVGIHGGPLGFKGSATVKGLATEVGDEYYNHWNLEYQPVGLINRGEATNYVNWVGEVMKEMKQTSVVKMEVEAILNADKIDITVKEEGYDSYNGMLQVWLLEDGIVAMQTMPDGTNNREYIHNHVLRTPVNGTWGESFLINKDEKKNQHLMQAVDADWDASKLSIVAFVYNGTGVEQVVKAVVK